MEDALRAPGRNKQAHIIAVTSGKGGVGKTFVSANLAAALTRHGFNVLVLDADLRWRLLTELARVEGLDPTTGDYRLASLSTTQSGDLP